MKRPVTDFKNLDSAQLIQYAEEIVKKMGEHDEIFETPVPALSEVSEGISKFRKAVAEAAFNDRQAIAVRNEIRKELEFMISDLAKYVDTIARGNETIVLSSGFIPSKTFDFGSKPNPKAHNLRVEPAGLGTMSIVAKVQPWERARYYQFEYRKKGVDMEWERVLSTRSVLEFQGLEAFQEYEFRATYLSKDTNPNYSDVISTFAL